MIEAEPPEPDRIEGAPHPRMTQRLFGQVQAEAEFLAALAGNRLHHGWLITGPRGIGKATLAWRIARHLLAAPATGEAGLFGAPEPAQSLDVAPDHPVVRRMAALSEPRLFLLRRPTDEKGEKLRTEITVDEVRKLSSFFGLSAADGGRRVAIVDAADDLNTSAANALLKQLEEPPRGAVLLLVAHQPARVLPTIRSRCRTLRLQPLGADALHAALSAALGPDAPDPEAARTIAALAEGSVGTAVELALQDGVALYGRLVALMDAMPNAPRAPLIALAEEVASGGAKDPHRLRMILTLTDRLLVRLARTGAEGSPPPEALPQEGRILCRLSPDPAAGRKWADLTADITDRVRRGRAVNLDPATLLVDMLLRIDAAAGSSAQR
jgi:DNA polymerase-3 subunit delta'